MVIKVVSTKMTGIYIGKGDIRKFYTTKEKMLPEKSLAI